MLALVTIVLMAVVTFATRAAGYLVFRATRPGPRIERFLHVAPKTMFLALVTPSLATGGVDVWVGAATALVLMIWRRNLLLALVAATLAVALVRAIV